ncbi:carbonic anhydrase 7-like isoform X2 [Diprion similis]|uniref:carbonic anhydrase 7-like isoform X2 n=1 Tax=Diprion similis TaxID=362088 RepID=UPI001EF88762|nr:carbonic anhydrase 7-like isoform X2 [Diprion similis]
MIKLFGVLLVISLNKPSFLDAHVLSKRENFPRFPDSPDLIDDPSSGRILWAVEDDRAEYMEDYVQDSVPLGHIQFQSILMDSLGNFEDYQDPEIQQDEGLLETDQNDYPQDEREEQRDYESRSQGLQTRGNVGLFQREVSGLVPVGKQNLPLARQEKPDDGMTIKNLSPIKPKQPAGGTSHFSYSHPEQWSLDSPECSGRLQSPVNLESNKLVALDVPPSLIWTGYWNPPQNLTITDTGHSVQLSGSWQEAMTPFISGGPLTGDYVFSQLHFHWGPRDSVGSEHTIDNKSFPMEMHMVHYKRDYQTFAEALKHDDGLAVVAFLFEMSDIPNLGINLLEDSFCKLQNKLNVRIPVSPYPLALLHHTFQDEYVFYIGSLTTPPCREIVTWLVSSSPLTISEKQLDAFRKISNKWPEKENYRPRQPLNGRNLYYAIH